MLVSHDGHLAVGLLLSKQYTGSWRRKTDETKRNQAILRKICIRGLYIFTECQTSPRGRAESAANTANSVLCVDYTHPPHLDGDMNNTRVLFPATALKRKVLQSLAGIAANA